MLLLLLGILLSIPCVQTSLGKYATNSINKSYGTNITIGKVAITPFGSVKLGDVLVLDHHQDTLFYIKKLNTSILSFKKIYDPGHPYLKDVVLHGLDVRIVNYKNEDYTNLDKFIDAFDDGTPSSGKFRMKANKMTVFNSRFQYIDYNLQTPKMLDFTQLNGKIEDFFIKGANVTTFIDKLSFKDHRGLFVENITADFLYTKKNILLEQLEMKTPLSEMKGRVELKYNRKDFSDFNNKVIFDVQFDKASIASNDLNYFYNEFGKNNVFYVDTHLIGTLNNFTTYNLKLVDKNQSEIIGTANFKNLFGKGNQEFYMNGNFDRITSNYEDLKSILPRILGNNLPSVLAKLGNVNIAGAIELTQKFINTDVSMLSQLGYLEGNLAMQNINNIDNASYQGNIKLDAFDLGALLSKNDIGKATLDLDVDGKGFTQKLLNTAIKGKIDAFYYNGYNYQNITVDGSMKMPYYKGYFNSNDPNLKMDFDGTIDLSLKAKKYDFKAQIDYADLHILNFYKSDSISILKGTIDFKADGNSIDDLAGILKINNVSYQNSKDSYFFEDFQITSSFDEEQIRTIEINSPDIITGEIVGKYKVNQVQKMVENALGSLYANYSPNQLEKGQFINFDLSIYDKIVEVFIPDVKISENTKAKGRINGDEGKFIFDFTSPNIIVYNNTIENVSIDIDNKNPLYNAYITVDSIKNSTYKIADFNLINLTLNDTLYVRSEFKGGPKSQDTYDLNLYHTIDENKQSVVGFKKSEIKFKDYLWFINELETEDNKIVFDKKFKDFDFQKLTLSHNDQKIDFYGTFRDSTYKDLNLSFNDVDLNKVTPTLDSLTFGGKINGKISYKQEDNKYDPISHLTIDSLKINQFLLGDLEFDIEGNENFNQFKVNSSLKQDGKEHFFVDGNVNFVGDQSKLDLEAGFDKFNLAPFGSLLGSVLSDVRGNATGRTTIGGSFTSPEIDGRLYLNDAGMRVPYLNVDYAFEKNAIVDLTEHQFSLRKIEVTDTKFNTKGVIDGTIKHKNLGDWDLDLHLISDNILALDTKDSDDTYYYGTAFMKGKASITGEINALVIKVAGESEKGTSIKIPVNDDEEIGDNTFINFMTTEEYQKSLIENIAKESRYEGIELDFNFDIDTDADIEIILNRETGHAMKGKGVGSMQMNINTLGKFEMFGDFIVQEGQYNFKYGGIIDKKFDVEKGGTIRWDGEPMDAVLDLKATYKTFANPAVLVESASFNRKVDTNVSILLNGNLSNPQPDFNIDFPTVSSVLRSELDYKLQDKDSRQTQAFALLATGSFVTAESTGNAAYGSLIEGASSIINGLFTDADSNLQFQLDYSQGNRLTEISDRVGVTLSTRVNDRITINGKANVPVGGVTETVIVGNLEVLIQINEDGTLNAHVFNRENDINYVGEGIGYTQGLGITYNVEFNTFKEMLQKIFSKNKKQKGTSKSQDELPDSEFPPEFIDFINQRKSKTQETPKEEPLKVPEID
ncbi:translocation/assembly module TamB domain-containing protein [Flavobacterium cyclinae]|uniref:translocation/assembly module TamB domain-containing protein n=1 Tax=Flavobacterium cyclinae TaxID=2895947 RepID=UPI001E506717|nr:translocation/assembly module TamB domain-containing protein [Flavobacterium cyclinae]UGS22250.1 translocation/assembly module TamB [Flavobacterium cyclinae]